MKITARTFLVTTAFTLITTSANAQNLHEAVTQAIKTHPEVRAALNNKTAISYELRQAKAGYFPVLDLQMGSGHERSNNNATRTSVNRNASEGGHASQWRNESSVTLSQMVFDGFNVSSQSRQQKARYLSAEDNLDEISDTIALRAIEAYLNVLRDQELNALAEENVKIHREHFQQVKARSEGGRGSQADVRQAQGRMALAEANLITFKGNLASSTADYVEAVGAKPSGLKNPVIPKETLPSSLEEALKIATQNNPAILSAKHDVDAAISAKKESISTLYPRFNIELSASRNENLDGIRGANNDAQAMLRMRYNLYNGGADIARKHERMELLEQARQNLSRDRRLVMENTQKAWAAYETASKRLIPLKQHVESSEETRTAYKAQFGIGQRTLLDLLDSEIELFNARNSLINARYDFDLAVYEVLLHAGSLKETLESGNNIAWNKQ